VYQRHRGLVVVDRVLDGRLDDAGGALLADRLDADAHRLGKANLLETLGERLGEELLEFLAIVAAVLELDARIDVFRVLAEDDHVGLFRMLHR
jgi:hypothetical protein